MVSHRATGDPPGATVAFGDTRDVVAPPSVVPTPPIPVGGAGVTLDLHAVGRRAEPRVFAWDERDTLLYAVAVGAGAEPTDLPFVTENSLDTAQTVLPTFGAVACYDMTLLDRIGDHDRGRLVHAAMRVRLRGPLPPAGAVRVESTVAAMSDLPGTLRVEQPVRHRGRPGPR